MGQTKAERFSKLEENVFAHGTIRKQGLIVLLIKKHLLAKFLKSVPATKQGKADMKSAIKRDVTLDCYQTRLAVEEYKKTLEFQCYVHFYLIRCNLPLKWKKHKI